MKAIVWTKYGPPEGLTLKEVKKPVPKDHEVMIKIHAATVTAGDCELRSLKFSAILKLLIRLFMGIRNPKNKILGQELAGEVEATGSEVTQFKEGDQVFAATLMRLGAYAEYVCLPVFHKSLGAKTAPYPIALKPANMSFYEAATIPTGGVNGLHFLRKGKIRKGQEILVYGAGGSIGTYTVQIAKSFDVEVTAVDSSDKLDMLQAIGADHVIDYTREDFTKSGKRYDIIIDVVGKSPFSGSVKSLKSGGRYILGNPTLSGMVGALWISKINRQGKKVLFALADYKMEEINFLKELIEQRKVAPVIDKTYPLERIAEAHTYVDMGLKKGNVVITM